ncbi:FadR/GntR family transcriptional regulator [Nocardioides caldifontis]|uniref:FadR/GntR family transcriptional regulator n=1 Tax=Nocardioides caldifontis TaxID=2588938 RepID=UPI0011DF4E96|nr:FCD domain-containing protein [Nocardioides caldifontis]
MAVDDTVTTWQPLGQGTLTDRIRSEILRVLTTRGLSPGDRLPSERELAASLRVSRPSVREAVRSLQAEGRLVVRHGQGVFVAEPTAQRALRESMTRLDHSLSELFAMREVLEVPAARWAAQRQDLPKLEAVQRAFSDLEEALQQEPRDYQRLQDLDAAFHLRIVQAAGNRLLEQSQGVLNDLLQTGLQTTLAIEGRAERSREEHLRILTALLEGDAAAAGRAAQAHVRNVRRAANRRIAEASARIDNEG